MATSSVDYDDKRVKVEWLNLPKELWLNIANNLHATIDLLRFRATCATWRSAVPLRPPSSRSLFPPPILIPHGGALTLLQTKIYRLQPRSVSDSSSSSSGNGKGWIIKLDDSKSSPIRLLSPVTNHTIRFHRTAKRTLNLIDFRFVELTESYSLNSKRPQCEVPNQGERELHPFPFEPEILEPGPFVPIPEVLRAIPFPVSVPPSYSGARMLFALYKDGKLRASRIGDENWTVLIDEVGNSDSCFDDLIVRTGQLYAVDRKGTILWVDCSSLKLVQYSPLLCGFGKRKQLVEWGGSLYVVDTFIEGDPDHPRGIFWEVVDVKVYRLDEEWGKWCDVMDLGDAAFVLGNESNFSVDARDYYGCEGNCIYLLSGDRACAFSLRTCSLKCAKLFWPCPSLFNADNVVQDFKHERICW